MKKLFPWKSLLVCVYALLGLTSVCNAAEPSMESPDHALRAVAVVSAPGGESRIEIRRHDAVLLTKSYASPDGQHGYVLEHAQWTADSQYFVFSMSSSGGHQPWRFPVFVYSRRHNVLAPLDQRTGPITAPDFQLSAADAIAVSVQARDGASKKVRVRLAVLFPAKP